MMTLYEIGHEISRLRSKYEWHLLKLETDRIVEDMIWREKEREKFIAEIESRQWVECDICKKVFRLRPFDHGKYSGTCKECLDRLDAQHTISCAYCGSAFISYSSGVYLGIPQLCSTCNRDVDIFREHRRVNSNNARTKKLGLASSLTLSEWIEILDRDNRKCVICGDKFTDLDHIIPVSKGGGTTKENVRPLCNDCNRNAYHRIRVGVEMKNGYEVMG